MLKQSLQQKQVQKLSPLQIQTIKLIELPAMELEQRIEKEVEENPLLEEVQGENEEEEAPKKVPLSEVDSTPAYKLATSYQGKDPKPTYDTFSVKMSFHQSLEAQLGFCKIDGRERQIAMFIIGMIDDSGYLRRDSQSLVFDVSVRYNIQTSVEEVERLISMIQEFEPAGVCSRDLRECLLLQLDTKKTTPSVELAKTILEDYFEEFKKKHYQKIMSKLEIDQDTLRNALSEIGKLNPRPGGQIDDSYTDQAQQIIPDFVVELKDGKPVMSMPRFNIPELKVNKRYADILMDEASKSPREQKEATAFVKQKLDSAKWFIEAIKQRYNTLHSSMSAILEYQNEFFIDGDETSLKPMVLRNIAEKTGLDISTISRVVNCKYVQTHFGIYPLKYFFSEGLMANDGEEVSTREIKTILSKSIDEEDKSKPLTDEELVSVLNGKGYKVARRTVAKYREQLNIPIARLRKEL